MNEFTKMIEKEAIEFTISKGFKGEEFQTQTWKKGGALKTDGTYKKLIKKLECFFEKVEVEGVGKRRVYILTQLKEKPTPYEDKRKGRTMPRATENQLLTRFVYQKLLSIDEEERCAVTLNNLAYLIPFVTSQINCFATGIEREFADYLSENKHRSIWLYSNWYLSDRAKKEIKLALEDLTKSGKIAITKHWYKGDVSNDSEVQKKEPLSSEIVASVRKDEKLFAEAHDIDYVEYQKSFSYPKQSEKMVEYGKRLRKFLGEKYGFEFIYEAMDIKIIDVPPMENELIPFLEIKEVFLKKAINLVKDKVKSDKYLKAQNKGEKFHYLCMLLFLREQWVEVDKHDLQRELDLIPFRLQEIADSYIEPKPIGFGYLR